MMVFPDELYPKGRRIFISHPYADNPEKNMKQVDKICKAIINREEGIPISPLHLFSCMKNDEYRQQVMLMCFDLIKKCDVLYSFGDSKGCETEKYYALDRNIEVIEKKVTEYL